MRTKKYGIHQHEFLQDQDVLRRVCLRRDSAVTTLHVEFHFFHRSRKLKNWVNHAGRGLIAALIL